MNNYLQVIKNSIIFSVDYSLLFFIYIFATLLDALYIDLSYFYVFNLLQNKDNHKLFYFVY